MQIQVEWETYRALTAIMHHGAETFDDVILDLLKRVKAVSHNSGDGVARIVPQSPFAYWYMGQWYGCDSGKDLLVTVLRRLCREYPGFVEEYAATVNAEGRTREYVSKSKEKLFPDNPKLQITAYEVLSDGWLLGTHMSNTRKTRMLRSACMVLGLRYGIDLIIKMSGCSTANIY